MRGLGDSPWLERQLDSEFFFAEWLEDILTVARELNPDDASNSVFIGLSSGAYWAVEAALVLRARGVCVINTPIYIDVLHSVRKLETSPRPLIRKVGSRLKNLVKRHWAFAKHRWVPAKHQWMAAAAWHLTRIFLPSAFSEDILAKLADDNTDLLLFYGVEEVWPLDQVPYFRSMDVRRLTGSSVRRIEFVPRLDHGMHFADVRIHVVEILDRHVLERFGGVARDTELGPIYPEES
jgi:hypothetical protein